MMEPMNENINDTDWWVLGVTVVGPIALIATGIYIACSMESKKEPMVEKKPMEQKIDAIKRTSQIVPYTVPQSKGFDRAML